jgi:peptide/nickel transport system permease protein
MLAFILRRIVQSFIIIIIVSIAVFLFMRLLPGDPIKLFLGPSQLQNITTEDLNALRAKYGLDRPYPEQYIRWMSNVVRGDFGMSLSQQGSVGALFVKRFPITLYLGVLSLIISSIFGVTAGLICALRRGGAVDALVTSFANFGVSVPVFWLGILMIYFFGYYLKWLPIQGYTSPFTNFTLSTRQIIMPVICISTLALASNARLTRTTVLEVLRQDYVRTAWSKGLRERVIVVKHVLKNSLIPVITMVGIQASMIIGGEVIIEKVFNIPGVGRLMVDAVLANDYSIVQGGCLIIATIVVTVNLLVDISYGWLDPRIRFG